MWRDLPCEKVVLCEKQKVTKTLLQWSEGCIMKLVNSLKFLLHCANFLCNFVRCGEFEPTKVELFPSYATGIFLQIHIYFEFSWKRNKIFPIFQKINLIFNYNFEGVLIKVIRCNCHRMKENIMQKKVEHDFSTPEEDLSWGKSCIIKLLYLNCYCSKKWCSNILKMFTSALHVDFMQPKSGSMCSPRPPAS